VELLRILNLIKETYVAHSVFDVPDERGCAVAD
jgi:hypothetical protein